VIPAGTKVYFGAQPTDCRRSFDGLAAMAAATMAMDPSQGGMFVFLNKRGDRVTLCILSFREAVA